ncbi:hypothetical protein EDD17DRAFT_1507802 [Pisolithus thermaeus]|nr:hypothetical protein EDD17DRAFT_1507802 [Pisolithus thermaeus]
MTNKLAYGQYHITNVGRNKYLGVSDFRPPPSPPASASVVVLRESFLPPEVMLVLRNIYEDSTDLDLPQFTIVPVDVEADNYVILVGRMVTRDRDNRVCTFANEPAEVWLIRYEEGRDAYTQVTAMDSIEKKEGMHPFIGWTAPSVDRDANPDQILIGLSPVPDPSQLFKFERVAAH